MRMNMLIKQFTKYYFIQNILLILLISGLALFSYGESILMNLSIFDDDVYVKTIFISKTGKHLKISNGLLALTEKVTGIRYMASLMLDCEIFGLNPVRFFLKICFFIFLTHSCYLQSS
jgi:hypothetical protein